MLGRECCMLSCDRCLVPEPALAPWRSLHSTWRGMRLTASLDEQHVVHARHGASAQHGCLHLGQDAVEEVVVAAHANGG